MTEEQSVKKAWTTPTLESLEMKETASGDNFALSESQFPTDGQLS